MSAHPTPPCCFDDWAAAGARRARSHETVTGVTERLVVALEDAGISGRSVLDLGSGIGDLLLALLARGATSGVGVDLGAGAVDRARALAASRGLADRVTFSVGDGSRIELPRSDIVTVNRVLCCYPDPTALLTNAGTAARDVLAFTAPVDHGVAGGLNRLTTWTSNVWYRLRRSKYRGFRVFVHRLDDVDALLASLGFDRVRTERVRTVWQLEVFVRRPEPR